jgi:hypothetical protein
VSEPFLPRFYRMVDELQAHPRIEVTDLHFAQPAGGGDLEAARRLAGGRLLDGMEDFYRETDGFLLEWRHSVEEARQGDDRDTGSIEILPLREVFKDWHGSIWFDGPRGDRFKAVRPLDFFVPEACACLLHDGGQGEQGLAPTLHYHRLGRALYDTGYGFTAYIDRLLASRGSWYWIETLCAATRESPQARGFFARMPHLFKDFQPDLFQPGPAR